MDKPDPGREAPDELTRESLIAISYSEPDKVLSSKLSSEKINDENVIEEADCDEEEKCRSELISISYQQSPEVECRPLELFERGADLHNFRTESVYMTAFFMMNKHVRGRGCKPFEMRYPVSPIPFDEN